MSDVQPLTIRLSAADNVVVARVNMLPGAPIGVGEVACRGQVPRGHKIAIEPIAAGEPIRKYNQIIGFATVDIAAGDHVHVHNVEMHDFARDYAFGADVKPVDYVPEAERATFMGFKRANGKVGTRNYIGVLSSVNCSATVSRYIAAEFEKPGALDAFPNVDGVVAITHSTGCGMADSGEGYANLQRTLWGYARNPNFAGVLLVGLGCEVNQIDFLLEAYGIERGPMFQTMNIQGLGGTRRTIEFCRQRVMEMLPLANEFTRTPQPASELLVALQCGGSDGYSGISANPALGAAVDILVRHGGTAVLSETPEVYGAEHLLTRRAVSRKVGEKLWRMPLNEAYDKAINSDAADVKNIAGSRDAGSIIGAQFLQRFVNNVPWAHLDIAGVTWSKKDTGTIPKGATSFGVRLLDRYVADVYEG